MKMGMSSVRSCSKGNVQVDFLTWGTVLMGTQAQCTTGENAFVCKGLRAETRRAKKSLNSRKGARIYHLFLYSYTAMSFVVAVELLVRGAVSA